jgi:hypothetical protein
MCVDTPYYTNTVDFMLTMTLSLLSRPLHRCNSIIIIYRTDDAGIYYQLGSQYSTNHLHTFQLL